MGRGGAAGTFLRPVVSERSLIGSAGLGVRLTGSRGLVLHQKGFDPVVVSFLQDPIRDRGSFFRHLEAFAERLGEALQEGSRQSPQGVACSCTNRRWRWSISMATGRSAPGVPTTTEADAAQAKGDLPTAQARAWVMT
jgi:hypothetical protein